MAKDKPAKDETAAAAPSAGDPPPSPMFYRDARSLDAKRHADTALKRAIDYSFAKQTNSVPLTADEFSLAMKT